MRFHFLAVGVQAAPALNFLVPGTISPEKSGAVDSSTLKRSKPPVIQVKVGSLDDGRTDPPAGLTRMKSHASPVPSASASVCAGFARAGQLSQASPRPSPSPSPCAGSAAAGQSSHALPTPSPSPSDWEGFESEGQLSHASPSPSWSASAWAALATKGQLSDPSATPSWSVSTAHELEHAEVSNAHPAVQARVPHPNPRETHVAPPRSAPSHASLPSLAPL